MIYHVQFTRQALEDLSHLDAAIARRISEKIQWLAEHYDRIQPETLTGPFATLLNLVLIQELFRRLDLKERLRRCFEHLGVSPIFGHATVVLSLVL